MKLIKLFTWRSIIQETRVVSVFGRHVNFSNVKIKNVTWFIDKRDCHIIWLWFQLMKTFKILSLNSSAFFRPRNESVLEKINELPILTSWSNPTNWAKIIKVANNYSDLTDESKRWWILKWKTFFQNKRPSKMYNICPLNQK